MKKNLLLIASAIILCFTSCSEVECDHFTEGSSTMSLSELVGMWYDPEMNEEIKYMENGLFYDRYANKHRAQYTEGQFSLLRGNRLSYTYSFMGQNQYSDLTISDVVPDVKFKLTSKTTGSVVLYKITDVLNVELGGSVQLPAGSYSSPDERILSIEGSNAKSNGMNGVVYLKSSNDTYVKVIAGTETNDMWMDYSYFIGKTITDVKNAFGTPSGSIESEIYYDDMETTHPSVVSTQFVIGENNVVTSLGIFLKDAVNEFDVEQFLGEKYFFNNTVELYTSHKELSKSIFVIEYYKDKKLLFFTKRPVGLLNFTNIFGVSKSYIKYMPYFNDKDLIFEKSDSIKYSIATDTDYDIEDVTFYFLGKGHLMSSYGTHYRSGIDYKDVQKALNVNYIPNGETQIQGYKCYQYVDSRYSKAVFLYPELRLIEYYDLTQSLISDTPWPDLSQYFNMTAAQLKENLGQPYSESEKQLIYFVNDNYLSIVGFRLDSETGLVNAVVSTIKGDADIDEMHESLKQKYYVYEKGTIEAESYYAFLDEKTLDTSSLGITLDKVKRTIGYFRLNSDISKAKTLDFSSILSISENDAVKKVKLNSNKNSSYGMRYLK